MGPGIKPLSRALEMSKSAAVFSCCYGTGDSRVASLETDRHRSACTGCHGEEEAKHAFHAHWHLARQEPRAARGCQKPSSNR